MLKDSLAVIGLSLGLDLKRSGRELTIKNLMDLGSELAAELRRIRSSDIPLERGELRSTGVRNTSIHFNGSTQKH